MTLFNREYRRRAAPRPYGALREAGFTLIELMIVCAVIAILAAIAYPSYVNQIVKTNRRAAEACLSEYSNYMERYYTTNLNYATTTAALPLMDCAASSQTGQNYKYGLAVATSTAYTLQATPISAQQVSKDAQCGTLTLDQTGTRSTSTNNSTCW
jgi:type IV pilus assembly protein PilE